MFIVTLGAGSSITFCNETCAATWVPQPPSRALPIEVDSAPPWCCTCYACGWVHRVAACVGCRHRSCIVGGWELTRHAVATARMLRGLRAHSRVDDEMWSTAVAFGEVLIDASLVVAELMAEYSGWDDLRPGDAD